MITDVTGIVRIGGYAGSAADPDGDPITLSLDPPGPYALGETQVTLTVTDEQGAQATCQATITVVDQTPPVIVCPEDIFVGAVSGLNEVVVEFEVTGSDNCDEEDLVECDPPSGSTFAVGTTTVNCVAQDSSGNEATCSFTVTVGDNDAPPPLPHKLIFLTEKLFESKQHKLIRGSIHSNNDIVLKKGKKDRDNVWLANR